METKKYIFTTLAVGTLYNYKVRTLIDCVNLLTNGDIMIITDDPEDVLEYINAQPVLDKSRIEVIDLKAVTDHNAWFTERQFNFNLKLFPTKMAYRKGGYDMIIHADADSFLIGWDEEDFQKFINAFDVGMTARFRNRPCEEVGIHFILEPKATALSLELDKIKARMPIEVFMFFNPKVPEFEEFLKHWEIIVGRCNGRGVNPFMEALEISYAMTESKISYKHILDYMNLFPVIHTFRYLHQDKIMRIL